MKLLFPEGLLQELLIPQGIPHKDEVIRPDQLKGISLTYSGKNDVMELTATSGYGEMLRHTSRAGV